MTLDINCAKCGEKICTLRMLKSIKDVLKTYNNKCPHCRQRLSTTDFTLNTEKKWVVLYETPKFCPETNLNYIDFFNNGNGEQGKFGARRRSGPWS